MIMKTHTMFGLILSAIGILGMVACGGGGGGDSAIAPAGLTYAGVTSPAIIDSNNAAELASDAFLGGETGTSLGIFTSVSGSQPTFAREIKLYEAVQVFNDALYKIDFESHRMDALAVQSAQETMYGDCGGSATYTMQLDDVSGAFTGSMNFDYFCNQNSTISGTVGFSGQLDMDTQEPDSFSFSINMVSMTSNNQSYVLDGAVSFVVNGLESDATINLLMKDAANETFWVKDYRLSITDEGTHEEIVMSGRFYHPTHGYVDLTTSETSPVIIYSGDEWPSEGILHIVGGSGSKAQLTAIDETTCEIEVDEDGDGSFDNPPGPITMNWQDV
jgi:hypothetical protein